MQPTAMVGRLTSVVAGFVLGAIVAVSSADRALAVAPSQEELGAARQFAAERLFSEAPEALPFSFVYDGTPSSQCLRDWGRSEQVERLESGRVSRTVVFRDPQTGLRVRCEAVIYKEFPTLEWTLYFENTGDEATGILEDVQALNAVWQGPSGEFLLHHALGSQASPSDYAPQETTLAAGANARFAPAGGRPSNGAWPYFNLQSGDRGVIVAVGWPGQWATQFQHNGGRGVRIAAGQELLRTKLLPGEEIRTPMVVLQFWHGTYIRSQNLWRRWMMAHGMPRPKGALPPPQFVASSSRAYEEMIHANEQNQIMHIDRYLEEELEIDYWWMDAGWYIQEHGWPQVGTWEIDRERFPRGFRPISKHAHAKGVKIIVWFEPERVMPGTWLYENHAEWLLRPKVASDSMAGLQAWRSSEGGSEPCVSHNPTDRVRTMANIRWEPGRLSFHPGAKGQYSVVRFTAPESGEYSLRAGFSALDRDATTAVYVLHQGRRLFGGSIDTSEERREADFESAVTLEKGETLDFVVGWGNGTHICDTTGVDARLTSPSGTVFDAARQFDPEHNPSKGAWSYGWLAPGESPDVATFRLYDRSGEIREDGPRLLNLGDATARQWLTDHIDQFLTREGIDLYRQDFNIDPLPFWRAADTEDRQGITENRYVCGYLAYWDELLRRNPGLLIDSCASGGRRNDLETMRRSVPLWRSDYAYEPVGHQCMTYGISLWLPYHGTGTVASSAAPYYGGGFTDVEPYAFWSNAAPSLSCGVDIRVEEIDYDALRRLYRQWRQFSRFYYGDYYPLTPYTQDKSRWVAWQFNCPEKHAGAVQAFRRSESPAEEMRLELHGLDPDGEYLVTVFGVPGSRRIRGRELMGEGLRVILSQRPSAATILYEKQD